MFGHLTHLRCCVFILSYGKGKIKVQIGKWSLQGKLLATLVKPAVSRKNVNKFLAAIAYSWEFFLYAGAAINVALTSAEAKLMIAVHAHFPMFLSNCKPVLRKGQKAGGRVSRRH